MQLSYAVVIRRAARNFSADCPDLPGCIATGRTVDETLRRMRAAIRLHLEGLRSQGQPVPRPKTPLARLVRQRGVEQVYAVLQVAA
jgi:predicted RNase H-like HicB family nuclease